LADANESRDWRIYADYAQVLINIAKNICRKDKFRPQQRSNKSQLRILH